MAHAVLSPSSAERWLHCTPSARLEAKEKDAGSIYAQEGTLAHAIAEVKLKEYSRKLTKKAAEDELLKLQKSDLFYTGIMDEIQEYVDFCIASKNAMAPDAVMGVEERLDLSAYAPDSFGTGDCILIDQRRIHIIDLKFGTGQVVDVVENPQLKLYALGAYRAWGFIFETIKEVWITIAQVRLGNIETYKIPVNDLLAWGEEIRPRAKMAYRGEGEREPGAWCRFCKVKTTCRKRTDWLLKGVNPEKPANTLSDKEIAALLFKAEDLKTWAKELEEYALNEALNGQKYDGWKIVAGRSVRKITDPDGLAKVLREKGYSAEQIYKPQQLEGITALEKIIGKKDFTALSKNYIEKPQGKPTLAPETDKRPELFSAENEFEFE